VAIKLEPALQALQRTVPALRIPDTTARQFLITNKNALKDGYSPGIGPDKRAYVDWSGQLPGGRLHGRYHRPVRLVSKL